MLFTHRYKSLQENLFIPSLDVFAWEHTTDCKDGDLRLADGKHSLERRVEVCYGGIWGTVCQNSWETADAMVVCRQLQNLTSGEL